MNADSTPEAEQSENFDFTIENSYITHIVEYTNMVETKRKLIFSQENLQIVSGMIRMQKHIGFTTHAQKQSL